MRGEKRSVSEPEENLERTLGTVRLAFYGVGTIVGAGIYTVIGAAAGQAGEGLWLSFVFAAIAASLSALSYAELCSTYPDAGAEFLFARKAAPEWDIPSFLVGWTIFFHSSATIAAVLMAFGGYLGVFVSLPALFVSYGLLIALLLASLTGIEKSSMLNMLMVSFQILGLLLLIAFGLGTSGLPDRTAFQVPSFGGALAGTGTLFFIYTGFEHMASLGSEVKHPERTIPRALLLTILITTLIYLPLSFIVLSVATPSELADANAPLALVGGMLHPWLPLVLGVAALFATANAAFSGLISVSRLLFGMASEGEVSGHIGKTNRRKAPWVATLLVSSAVALLLLFGEIRVVAGMSSLGALTIFITVNLSLITLRVRAPRENRPFKVPLAIGRIPLPPVAAILVCLTLIVQYEWKVYAAFFVAVVAGVILHSRAHA